LQEQPQCQKESFQPTYVLLLIVVLVTSVPQYCTVLIYNFSSVTSV
jgi:hypothetical protein